MAPPTAEAEPNAAAVAVPAVEQPPAAAAAAAPPATTIPEKPLEPGQVRETVDVPDEFVG